jgi:hypothetical protein
MSLETIEQTPASVSSGPTRTIWVSAAAGLGLLLAGWALWAWPEATAVLESTPPGAEVFLDGKPVGQTPLRLVSRPLPLRGQLALQGYQTWRSDEEIQPGGTASQDVSLLRLPPVSDPAPAEAEASGQSAVPEAASNSLSAPALRPEPPPALDLSATVYPVAVIIENAPESRPQSGLGSADIVFEAMAEGEISRFMAVYVQSEAPIVGPVRSARHYFINLAAELGASVVHVGSSPLGYVSLQWYGLRNLEEISNSGGFWRSRFRPSPHNAYTSVAAARQALDRRASPATGSWGGFTFKDPERRYSGVAAPGVSLVYEPWGYRVEYRYDVDGNSYARFMGEQPHLDAESGAQLQASSVAVLSVKAWQIDTAARLDMEQVGSGQAAYFVDGVVLEGSWSKASTTAPTLFLDGAGNPIRFNPGPIWVQLISPESKVTY